MPEEGGLGGSGTTEAGTATIAAFASGRGCAVASVGTTISQLQLIREHQLISEQP